MFWKRGENRKWKKNLAVTSIIINTIPSSPFMRWSLQNMKIDYFVFLKDKDIADVNRRLLDHII